MWLKSFYLILLIFENVHKSLCIEKSSLVLVIDNTYSMTDDIEQVKVNADGISHVVLNNKASQIKNMILVTFNDPGTELVTITENNTTFYNTIANLRVTAPNMDCPEFALTGILQALDASLHGSILYVFTDASAKDYYRVDEVKNLCQKKQAQITFVLTGRCRSGYDKQYDVYYDIASASSGLVIAVVKTEVTEIVSTIKETIVGNKTVLTSRKIPAHKWETIQFEIDDQMEYAIVTASGSNVKLKITPTAGVRVTWLHNVKSIKLNRPNPGIYSATVKGASATSVYIVARSDFFFTHGFSELVPKSLKDTTPQPIANTPTQLSISVTDPNHTVDILLVHILNMDEQIIDSLLLREVSTDFYTTSNPFRAPSQRFKIAVIGRDVHTTQQVRRLGKIPITPQEPPKVLTEQLKPTMVITEGSSVSIEYGQTTKLTCKVRAYPEPIIKWFSTDKSQPLSFQSSVVEPPYEYISYLTVTKATENATYTCVAVNEVGTNNVDINVIVKGPFVINSAIKDVTEIQYGTKGILTCDITAPVPMHITWSYINETSGSRELIRESNSYSLSLNKTVLTFKKMDFVLIGTYVCQASLDSDRNKKSVHSTQVKIGGLMKPEAAGVDIIKVVEGSNVNIKCQITGVPEPNITWQYKAIGKTTVVLKLESQNMLNVSKINTNQAGIYKCIAHNVIGNDEHLTTVIVQVPPNIVSSGTKHKAVEGKAATLNINCQVTGVPPPTVTWTVKGSTITENSKYTIKGGTLVIREPKVRDSDLYKCYARNSAGSTDGSFVVVIDQAPKITGEASKTIKMGDNVDINCRIVKGVPKPIVTWHFKPKESSELVLRQQHTNVLKISQAHWRQAGTYKCIASNDVGSDEHLTTLNVEFAPIIISDPSKFIEGIEGDIALNILCEAIGEPKPSVLWKINGTIISPNEHYLITDRALIVKDPKKNDSQLYTCEARNYLGHQEATFNATVTVDLDSYGPTKEVNVKYDDTIKLRCLLNDSADQSIRWFLEGQDTGIKGNFYHIVNANLSSEGNYTCRVSDINRTSTKTYVVIIGYPPTFNSELEDSEFKWSGDDDDEMDCEIDAKPEPNIIWTFNGKVLRDQTSALVPFDWGNYTCTVKNVHGLIQRTYKVISSQCLISRKVRNIKTMPLVLTPTWDWPIWDSTTNFLKINPRQKVKFACPNVKDKTNSLKAFPGLNEVNAECDEQDNFNINGKQYKVSNLQCVEEATLIVKETHDKCLSETSELIRIGFNVSDFLETYEVCFDKSKSIPLYARKMMSKSNQGPGFTYPWYKYSGIKSMNKDTVYTCENQYSQCCYGKIQLINSRDFDDGLAQESSFIDPLNAVPYWRPSDEIEKSPWDSIEVMIRSRLKIFKQFTVWSGTHNLQEKNGGIIPQFLWKMVRFNKKQVMAIVYINHEINDPSPSINDILCHNTCPSKDSVPWFQVFNKHTYCCDLDDFLRAFNLRGTNIGESVQ